VAKSRAVNNSKVTSLSALVRINGAIERAIPASSNSSNPAVTSQAMIRTRKVGGTTFQVAETTFQVVDSLRARFRPGFFPAADEE
jgi:hypothetical protein